MATTQNTHRVVNTANIKPIETAKSKTPQYLSPEQIRGVATDQVDWLTNHLAAHKIPQPYKYELETDEATVELRRAIEKYIARMQDERKPY
jgi:hypothetical protein